MKTSKKPYRPPAVRSEKILVANLFSSSDLKPDPATEGQRN